MIKNYHTYFFICIITSTIVIAKTNPQRVQGWLELDTIKQEGLQLQATLAKIKAKQAEEQQLQRNLALTERMGVLTGAITGFDASRVSLENPSGAVYADEYAKKQAANGYVSDAMLLAGNTGGVNRTANNNNTNNNIS